MMKRCAGLREFLEKAGWGDALLEETPADASQRRYARAKRGDGTSAMVMITREEPPGLRRDYMIRTRRATDSKPFAAAASWLRELGLSAPRILAASYDEGLALVEDLGLEGYEEIMDSRDARRREEALGDAVDVLVLLREAGEITEWEAPFGGGRLEVGEFSEEVWLAETQMFLDAAAPDLYGWTPDEDARARWREAWSAVYRAADGVAAGRAIALRDYHSPNLMRLGDREGVARAGLLDFQDAVRAVTAYDAASLLLDARRDLGEDAEAWGLRRYLTRTGAPSEAFRAAFAACAAQTATRILGTFADLARQGKTRYLAHKGRLEKRLSRALEHEAAAPAALWFKQEMKGRMKGLMKGL